LALSGKNEVVKFPDVANLRRQPNKPIKPRPVAKRVSVVGSGTEAAEFGGLNKSGGFPTGWVTIGRSGSSEKGVMSDPEVAMSVGYS
jgi:hypothetical protein